MIGVEGSTQPARSAQPARSPRPGSALPPGATLPSGASPPAGDGQGAGPGAGERARRRPALSPSRAGDFKQCPLLYRFRTIDRLPEVPDRLQVRGTLVHAVLERLFELPAAQRLPEAAKAMVPGVWAELLDEAPALVTALFDGPEDPELAEWLASAGPLLDTYFAVEDPRGLEPAARELLVETELASGLLLRGIVDRIDVARTGAVRVVDYKTGASPRESGEGRVLFQLKFYALALLHLRGEVPAQLLLIYLANGERLTYTPDEDELRRFERTLDAIWAAILEAGRTGDFRPNPGPACGWCDHKALCPAWDGTPPPYPGWPEPDPAATDTAATGASVPDSSVPDSSVPDSSGTHSLAPHFPERLPAAGA
ncbi:MAG: RecB family exonuclease [Pseudonocardia sp.]|nr:RecB family exonuclease [Pseudonocardia sp.]